MEEVVCAACSLHIRDRFMLRALGKLWHEDCLKCTCCHCRLGELGSKLYYKQSMILCARDYLRLFGLTGICAACDKNIPAFELVMRAKSNVYHLQCFACQICNHRFCIGDKYYLCDNKILCQYDYEERMTFLQAAYNNHSFTEITKNIQQLEDFEPVMNVISTKNAGDTGGRPPRSQRNPLRGRLSVERRDVFAVFEQLAVDNHKYFRPFPGQTEHSKKVRLACSELLTCSPPLQSLVQILQGMAPRYDYDEHTPGNGFRSLVTVCDLVMLNVISVLRDCKEQRKTVMFKGSELCKELDSYCQAVRFLLLSMQQVINTAEMVARDSLFPPLDGEYGKFQSLLRGLEVLDSSCFYGRPLGFQFSCSVRRIFRLIGAALASYGATWGKGHGALSAIIGSGYFMWSPEERAAKIAQVTREADIEFCKSFWNLAEVGNVPKLLCPAMAVNEVLEINWVGPITIASIDGGTVRIPEPSAHTGVRPVRIRVLSFRHRKGLSGPEVRRPHPMSPYLLLHCHGGGFVATSSKSHESYLRMWAKQLNCPIVSVDYSLAPDDPFPRPTEEVLFVYAYALTNPRKFGWTGEKICMVGDSAGGNLVMSVNLRLIQLGVQRKPDGVVMLYSPFLFQYLPSPSRLLSFMDPLLHLGVVLRCVDAYTGGSTAEKQPKKSARKVKRGKKARKAQARMANGHPSLQDYANRAVRNQQPDALKGSREVVAMLNLGVAHELLSVNGTAKPARDAPLKSVKPAIGTKEVSDQDDGANDRALARSQAAMHKDMDRMLISSSVHKRSLVNYFREHPIAQRSLEEQDIEGLTDTDDEEDEHGASGPIVPPTARRPSELQSVLYEYYRMANTNPTIPPRPRQRTHHSIETSSTEMMCCNCCSKFKANNGPPKANEGTISKEGLLKYLKKDPPTADKAVDATPRALAATAQIGGDKEQQMYVQTFMVRDVPKDPLISPIYATAEQLRQLPPMWFIACHMDPLLDDTVAFARKARESGGKVMAVDILENLPHGFLNFLLVSNECRRGSNLAVARLKEALKFEQ